jgi:hypothetical protein
MKFLEWIQRKQRDSSPPEFWLSSAGLAVLWLGLGMIVTHCFPSLGLPLAIPLVFGGLIFAGIGFRGFTHKQAAKAADTAVPGITSPADLRDPDVTRALILEGKLPDRRREWRTLAPDQIAVWSDALAPHKIPEFHIIVSDLNSQRFCSNLREVANSFTAGSVSLRIDPRQEWGSFSVPAKFGDIRGITFLAAKDYGGAPVLLGLLRSSGYQARWEPLPDVKDEVIFFIGEKP